MRASERRFWRALGRYALRLLIFAVAGLAISAIAVFLIGEKIEKQEHADDINRVKNSFASFRDLCNKGDYEQARVNLQNRDYISVNVLQAEWKALENHPAGAPQWTFEEASYSSDPQVIELNYLLENNGKYPRQISVRYVPIDSSWGIKEINVNLLDLHFR